MNPSLFSDTCGLPQYLFYRMGQFLARLRFPFLVHAGLFLCISSIPHFKQFNPCHMILCHQMTADTKYIYLHRCQNKKTLLLVTGMCVALSVPQGDKGKVASPPSCQPLFDLYHMVIIREEHLAVSQYFEEDSAINIHWCQSFPRYLFYP